MTLTERYVVALDQGTTSSRAMLVALPPDLPRAGLGRA